MNMFRPLRHDEIDCRISQIKKTDDGKPKGLSLLLYKDARCDQNILDETVGEYNWKREHSRDNRNCTVSLWDKEKQQWVGKEDTGTESNTEKEKGLASDSFKRACFNWGIGRELYTAPFIWVKASDCKITQWNGKLSCYDNFTVAKIDYADGVICEVQIRNENTGKICFAWKSKKGEDKPERPDNAPDDLPVPEQPVEPKADVSVTNAVSKPKKPEVDPSSPMGYLQNQLSIISRQQNTTMESIKATFAVTCKAAAKKGLIPEKKMTEFDLKEVKTVLEFMQQNMAEVA